MVGYQAITLGVVELGVDAIVRVVEEAQGSWSVGVVDIGGSRRGAIC